MSVEVAFFVVAMVARRHGKEAVLALPWKMYKAIFWFAQKNQNRCHKTRFNFKAQNRDCGKGSIAAPDPGRLEQSAGRRHFVAIAVDIQETAEDRTVCSELSIAPPRLTHWVT